MVRKYTRRQFLGHIAIGAVALQAGALVTGKPMVPNLNDRLVGLSKVKAEAPVLPINGEEQLRNAAWNERGLAYNPEAALARHARLHMLGNPVTNEFDLSINGVVYRAQGFSKGIVYARVGDWGNVQGPITW